MKNNKVPRFAAEVARKLKNRYGDFSHNNYKNPLIELLFIICSTKSSDKNSRIAYSSLRKKFPTFKRLERASQKAIRRAIIPGGLYNNKAAIIKKLIDAIKSDFGKLTLTPLKKMSASECEAFLLSLPGAGKKVARCVMMYSLGHQVFPVDAHCWKISKRLGWARQKSPGHYCSAKEMDMLQEKIKPRLRYSLHVNMVSLGKDICTFSNPKCYLCPITKLCAKKR